MPFSRQGLPEHGLASSTNASDQACVWTLNPDGMVEHAVIHGVVRARVDGVPAPWREFWPEEGWASVDRAVAMAAEGQVARFRMLGCSYNSVRTYWDTVVAPARSRDGSVTSLVATSTDATAEVERESLLNTVVQMLPSPVAVKDVESGGYILWNRAAEAAFELPAEQVLGRSALDMLGGDLGVAFVDAESEAVRTGERQTRSASFESETSSRAIMLQTLATFDDFGARHLISLCSDVSESQAAAAALKAAVEAAEQASESKSQFLANMSHELRTPMNGIMAGADMLAAQDLAPRAQELVTLIQGSSGALERLLSGILDLAAIEAGGMTLEPAPFHLGDLVSQVAGLARLSADEKGVALKVVIEEEADGVVVGDRVRLGQVLTNLLTNAAKFTERGEIQIHALRTGERVRVAVSDTGIGFDEAARLKIFERFQQADGSITRRFGGSGLGLAITRELVALMDGSLDCESEVGVGSRFWFELPLPRGVEAPSSSTVRVAPTAPGNLRILAADDHPTNRRVVELLLASVADVVCVADGREAVDAYRTGAFDLVLMDMQMPVMDGLTAVREIRELERREGRGPTPILMLSANVAAEHVEASVQAGADQHVPKPINAANLFAAIADVLA